MKSYNIDNLLGDESYDDSQFQADYRDMGIEIPDSLLYTPELNVFVAKAERDKAKLDLVGKLNPRTFKPYTEEQAAQEADRTYKDVIANMSIHSGVDLKKYGA